MILTSCHLRANLWSKFYLDLCKSYFLAENIRTMPNSEWSNALETAKSDDVTVNRRSKQTVNINELGPLMNVCL